MLALLLSLDYYYMQQYLLMVELFVSISVYIQVIHQMKAFADEDMHVKFPSFHLMIDE
jgi:hypothetical protein